MGKIIISESQYRKVKQALIESAISKTLINEDESGSNNQTSQVDPKTLGIDTKNGTLTLQNDIFAENAQGSTRDELKLYKGAVFKIGQNFASNGILVSNTKIQMVGSLSGGAGSAPRKSTVHYYCKKGKFNIPGLPDSYFIEKNDSTEGDNAQKGLNKLCQLGKNPQVSTQGRAGQTTYNSKNPAQLTGKKDQTKKLTIPANTAFSFNSDKNGVGFKLNYQNGWFDCKTATFVINSVQYNSKFLADALTKNLCKSSNNSSNNSSDNSSNNSSQTQQPGNNVGGSGSGGGGPVASSSVVSDMANYV